MSLREMLSDYWYAFQQELFPRLESELGPMGERYELFVAVLELVRVEALLPYFRGQVGRPEEDRAALARAFIAKAVFDVPTTRGLIERLEVDGRLWRLCGWSGAGRLPSEATFSRAFSEFAESRLANRLHETLIARTMDGHLVEHISRDATAIEAREKPAPKPKAAKPKRRRKRGRPRKGEEQAKEPSRLERQLTMNLPQMLADLPRACDVGTKRNAKGHTTFYEAGRIKSYEVCQSQFMRCPLSGCEPWLDLSGRVGMLLSSVVRLHTYPPFIRALSDSGM